MILTVTPNVAVDRTAVVDELAFDRVLRPTEVLVLPGGKGINVARAARTLGAEVMTTGLVGGTARAWFVRALDDEGLRPRFVDTDVEPRTAYVAVDGRGRTVRLYEPGLPTRVDTRAALRRFVVDELIADADLVVLSGSLPSLGDTEMVRDLVGACGEHGVACVVDMSGSALMAAMAAGPVVVKINEEEARDSGLSGTAPHDLARAAVAAGAQSAVITLGSRGAVGFDGSHVYRVSSPAVEARFSVGSGDAFCAGFATALERGADMQEAMRAGTAAGAANTLVLGAGRFRVGDHERLLASISVVRE